MSLLSTDIAKRVKIVMQITGKVFVVTGGGNGIGREVVLQLLSKGASVAAVDLSDAALQQTAALSDGDSSRLSSHVVNITDREAVAALPDAVVAAHGQVDGVVHVAGIIQPFKRMHELTMDEIERVMNVNFWGTVNVATAFLPTLLDRPAASLVNVSSMSALVPIPGQSIYGASKAAVKSLTDALYAESRGTNLAVTVVFPGAVSTNITANSGVEMPTMGEASEGKAPNTTSPADAARQIVAGIEKGSYRVRIGGDAKLLDRLGRLMPQRSTAIIADRMKALLDR